MVRMHKPVRTEKAITAFDEMDLLVDEETVTADELYCQNLFMTSKSYIKSIRRWLR